MRIKPTINQIRAWWNEMKICIPQNMWSRKQWRAVAISLQEDNGILLDHIAELQAQARHSKEYQDEIIMSLKERLDEVAELPDEFDADENDDGIGYWCGYHDALAVAGDRIRTVLGRKS